MPIFSLVTNVPQEKISDDLVKELSRTVAQILHKPESYVVVHVRGGESLAFGGDSKSPAGFAFLKSIGGVGGKVNNSLAKSLFPIVEKFLGIQGDRLYIEFQDLPASAIAHNGQTFG